jgi:hypothetical protein
MSRMVLRNLVIIVLLVLAEAATASAQVTAGDASMNLDGTMSVGYAGSFANEDASSHGIGFGGTGNLSGFYYSPQFLSFSIAPFFDQSRNNSTYQSITDSSGVTASTSIFGGSNYPGYVNYSDVYNSEGNYFLPGIPNYKTNGNSQTFGVGWSGHPTDTLSFSGGYEGGTSNSSVYGLTNEINSDFHSVFGELNYTLAGFRLAGGVHYSNGEYTFPQLLAGQTSEESQVDTTTYDFNLSRSLPRYDATTWLSYTRDTTSYNALGTNDSETDDVVTVGLSLKPVQKLSASFGADYDDNLAGAVYQTLNSVGALVPSSLPAEKSDEWGLYGEAQYDLTKDLYLTGDAAEREQTFLGTSESSTAWSGGADYGHQLFGGRFTGGAFVTESSLGDNNGSILGLTSNVIYSRYIAAWNVSGSFGYTRNAETFLIGYTTSGYSYSTSVSRELGKLTWNGTAAGSKTLFSEMVGTTSFTQSYSMGLSCRWLGVSGGYARSSGIGLYTNQGIVTVPTGLPPTLLPSSVPYSGTTYSIGLGGAPIRGLIFSGSFAKTTSSTESGVLASSNLSEEANGYVQYQFRKVFFTGGYSRLVQGFSASSLAPAMVSTYYVGISRWFRAF